MKNIAEQYELSRTDLDLLAELSQSQSYPTDLAGRVDRSLPVVLGSIKKLVARGFVTEERHGKRKIVKLSDTKHAQLIRELFLRFGHVPWQDLLSFSGIIPLIKQEQDEVQASRSTEWRALRNLMSHGIVHKQNDQIEVNPRFKIAEDFVQELQNYNNRTLAKEASPRSVIVWSKGSSFIIRVPGDETVSDHRFQPTATTMMAEYGIPLISNFKFYAYTPKSRKITPEETLLHTLLTDGNTNTTYALMLLAKGPIDRRKLLAKAKEYGLTAQIKEMIQYLDDHKAPGAAIKLPPWPEFAEKIEDYEVPA